MIPHPTAHCFPLSSRRVFRRLFGVAAVACSGLGPALAQTPPDAGRLLDSVRRAPAAEVPSRPVVLPESAPPPAGAAAVAGPVVFVREFVVEDVTVLTPAEISNALAGLTGRALSFGELEQAAGRITALYRERGYMTSRAYVPPQEVAEGVVRLVAVEGRLAADGVRLQGARRLGAERVRRLLRAAVPEGGVLQRRDLERALLLLNDLPGVAARATLVPGASVGSSELVVETLEGGLVAGGLEFDNFGNRYTGEWRGGGSLQLNDPTGAGDLLGGRVLGSGRGLAYARGFYQRPVGAAGARIGVAVSGMESRLGGAFAQGDFRGRSRTAGLYSALPLVRSRGANLTATFTYDYKLLANRALGVETSDRQTQVGELGVTGELADSLGGGGTTVFTVALAGGHLDLSGNAADRALDASSARAAGGFGRVQASVARHQRLGHGFSAYAASSVQRSTSNLDSAEKFYLGGPFGVRAFPANEAGGDSGYLVTGELRWTAPRIGDGHELQLAGFVDHGGITAHQTTWAGWDAAGTAARNSYTLSGAGLGVTLSRAGRYQLRCSYSWKLAGNPGRDADGNDSDGRSAPGRFWLQAACWF